ncbi:unnamed protein product [Fraxinus pennsylvanica]|uniref:Uncharacterized protein n=1 Tax=Fraxinus pennsylvanica TaxID=56036 RepID=A0AAD2DX27_9LAMI|nr:unnamed protein product [Fraxinus pennsylvanica]
MASSFKACSSFSTAEVIMLCNRSASFIKTALASAIARNMGYADMVLPGFTPDWFTFSSVLSACSELGWLFLGQQLHRWVIKSGLCFDVCVGCSLVDMYEKCAVNSSMDDSRKIYNHVVKLGLASVNIVGNSLIGMNSDSGDAFELYSQIDGPGVGLDAFRFAKSLEWSCKCWSSWCGNIEVAFQDFKQMDDRTIGM